MPKESSGAAWSVEQRLAFIEFRLYWEGGFRRADIREKFGVSIPQTSLDIARYREEAPGNLDYDARAKQYVVSTDFKPIFHKPNPDRYLAQIRAIREHVIDVGDTLIGDLPDCDVVPLPSRAVSAHRLRRLVHAIVERRSVSIEYRSMNATRPDALWREITPHALVSDHLRWHVRGYCHIEGAFKDFILTRCLRVGKLGDPAAAPEEDSDWHTCFEVELVPNPALSPEQQETIALDYGMKGHVAKVGVRQAMLLYFHTLLRLDVPVDPAVPKRTPVVVANRDAYDRTLSELLSS